MIFCNFSFIINIMLVILLTGILGTYCQNVRLLTSYLPASMQALAYYIEQLQYEPSIIASIEPPFNAYLSIITNESKIQQTTENPLNNNGVWSKPIWWKEKEIPTKEQNLTMSQQNFNWWRPPTWWQKPFEMSNLTLITSTKATTSSHGPGVFSPYKPMLFQKFQGKLKNRLPEGYEIFSHFEISDTDTLADLPLSLINDIRTEKDHDYFTNDVDSLDNFLRLYEDNYGRESYSNSDAVFDRWSSASSAGKKRVPPNKPYVEFLLVYDLLKRDAKAENLSKYDGYSDEILKHLHSLSLASAPRQLYTLFQSLLDRRDIQRSDVVSRIRSLQKELGNPETVTSKALQYIPAMKFLL